MLGGRRRRTSTSRNEDGKGWAHESDSDRPRPTMMVSQRPNVEYPTDRHHRMSRRPDPSGNPPATSVHPAPKGPSSRDYVDAAGSSYYAPLQSQNQAAYPQMATGATSSSRARAPDAGHESNTMLAYLKRKTERRSPRSSDEKVHAGGHSKSSRQQPRTSVVPAAAVATSSTRPQPAPEVVMSSRDKERDREKRRQRELEKERLRAEEERYRAAAAALEADKERQRRREEKELRRAEREKEKERERRKEEKEFERARRHREKEKLREKESRARDDGRAPLPGVVYPYQTAASSTRHHTEGRGSVSTTLSRAIYAMSIIMTFSWTRYLRRVRTSPSRRRNTRLHTLQAGASAPRVIHAAMRYHPRPRPPHRLWCRKKRGSPTAAGAIKRHSSTVENPACPAASKNIRAGSAPQSV